MSLFTGDGIEVETIGEPQAHADEPFEIRRRAGLAVALGAGASLVAIAYLARAVGQGGILDWILFVVLGLIGVLNLAALLDARTPLLVADDLGIRLRLGRTWVGLPWGGLDLVEHRPRRGWLRDGTVALRPRYPQRVLEDLDARARRWARISTRIHGAPLAVPLGLATRVDGGEPDVTSTLRSLCDDPTRIVELAPTSPVEAIDAEPDTTDLVEVPGHEAPTDLRLPDPRPAIAHLIGVLGGLRARRHAGVEADVEEPDFESFAPSATPEPARATVVAARAEVRHETRVELAPAEETQSWSAHELAVALDRERDHEVQHEAPVQLTIEDFDDQPAIVQVLVPVIGPQFARARTRLGLSVDELAERTRIRPHVIEAIEVDDFTACGGDFYARGHVRTLARVLGVEVVPILATYDEEYADAPIDPRRVFEAELAGAGSIRSTRGGPNWSVLVAAVMALVLCWSVARLLTDGPAQLPDRASLSGSGGPNHSTGSLAKPVSVRLEAAGGGARVVVRDGSGKVVFNGNLSFGQKHTLRVSPPVRVQTTDGSLEVTVARQARGHVGTAGQPATASYVVRH